MRKSQRGHTLAESITVVAIAGLILMIAIPAVSNMLARIRLRDAVQSIYLLLRQTRQEAMALERYRAVKFISAPEGWRWAVYEDTDFDGVRNDDINRGVDRLMRGPALLLHFKPGVALGLPSVPVRDPDDGTLLDPATPGVNFNRSTLCSFSEIGDCTPGSIYVTVGDETAVIRCSGDSGAIRVFYYDRATRKWTG